MIRICLSCGCEIVTMHLSDSDCLNELRVQIPSLQKKLLALQAAQDRITERNASGNVTFLQTTAPRGRFTVEK